MNQYEKRMAAELLERASDEFSNHGCNDLKRPKWFPKEDWESMHKRMYHKNGDPENYHKSEILNDYWVMDYLGDLLLESVDVKPT